MEKIPQDFSEWPRCLTIHPVKLKNTNYWQMLDTPENGCTFTGGESASPTNTKKGQADKRKIIMQTIQRRVDQ